VAQRTKNLALIFYIVVANLADAILTYSAVSSGKASELNPLMAFLLEANAVYFFLVKLLLVTLGLVLLFLSKNQKLACYALWVCAAAYTVILIVHANIHY